MSVQVLISAFRDSIHRVPAVLATLPSDVDVLVLHQNPDAPTYDYDAIFDRSRLEIHPFGETGLARSRNKAAALATGDILIPTDDDVRFLPGAISDVENRFMARPDASILTFQALDEDGRAYKRYNPSSFRHHLGTIRRVFSIEIAVRKDALANRGLAWDELFGLNSRYPGGLELAFMKNALDLDLRAFYEPLPIVKHLGESTGHRHTVKSAFFRGAVYAKLYGAAAYLLLAGFAARNAWRTGSAGASVAYTRELYRGATDYRTHRSQPDAG